MFAALLIAALSILPQPDSALKDACDLTEVNHYFDEHGRIVFDQLIWWDWNHNARRFECRDWRLAKQPSQLPCRDWDRGGYVTTWQDGEQMRIVRSRDFRETWLQFDPELYDRELLPKECRRVLRRK